MKIEIDLNDILSDEDGAESLRDSVRRQVVEAIVKRVSRGLDDRIDKAVSETITANLNEQSANKMPTRIENLLDQEDRSISGWGELGPATTIRNEMAKAIKDACRFDPQTYSSRDNAFTKVLSDAIHKHVYDCKNIIDSTYTTQLAKEAMEHAQKTLAARLGIKA